MARIRTIKPDFFRHEELQELEAAHLGKFPMLVFEGLWGHCDKAGRFEWRPRQLKLDILPFLNFDMAETLSILERAGFIQRYEADGKQYGSVPTFLDHQRISGKEAQEPAKHPEPPVKQRGKKREATEKHQGRQEEEGNGVQEGNGKGGTASPLTSDPEVALIAWNQLAERIDLPKVQRFTSARKRSLVARLRDYGGVPGWMTALSKLEASSFCRGKNDRGWRADFDFLVQESSFAKLMEGKYDDRPNGAGQSAADDDFKRQVAERIAAAQEGLDASQN